jgi:prevent-host-death family protein
MSTVTALEAKTRLGELLNRVAQGEEVVITRHDKPVARLVPEGGRTLAGVRSGVDELRNLRAAIRKRTRDKIQVTAKEVREAIEEGRL